MDGWMEFFLLCKRAASSGEAKCGRRGTNKKARLPHDGEGGNTQKMGRRRKKEAKLAARGGGRRWSGLRDTEEVGERDEKSRCRVDQEMNNDWRPWTRYPEYM